MKRFRRIITGIAFSLIAQFLILYYLNNVLFKESKEVNIQSVDVSVKSLDTDAEIPSEATEIKVSYTGKFIIYFLDDKLMLVNTKTSETKEILNDTEILNVKWVPNNNTLFIVENKDKQINVKTYNANNDVEQDVQQICSHRSKDKIDSFISTSAEYVQVTNGNRSKVYRINIDKDPPQEIKTRVSKAENASAFWQNDIFVYQDSSSKKVYKYTNGSSRRIDFNNPKNLVILKTAGDKDYKNIIYMGEYTKDNKISKIIYGEDEVETSKWKNINLESSKEIKDIYINENGDIFINNESEKKIKNLNTNEEITYKGKLIDVNERVICSLENNKVCFKSVKNNK